MKKIRFYLLAFLILPFVFSSCSTEGCIDPDAVNYNPDANKDCDCCLYEGRVVFWLNQAASLVLTADGVSSLTYYVDNKLIGSSAASVYYTEAPSCGQEASITATYDLGGLKQKTVSYLIKDEDGTTIYHGEVTFEANKCLQFQLGV